LDEEATGVSSPGARLFTMGTSSVLSESKMNGNAKKVRPAPSAVLSDASLPDMPSTSSEEYRNCPLRRNSRAIVLDCGSHMFRAGFSKHPDAVHQFPPLVARIRDPLRPELRHVIGYGALSHALRSTAKPAFDAGIPTNAAMVERLFDGTLAGLGLAEEDRIEHRFVVTEPPCAPNAARATFTELIFEAYDAPAVAYGIDALFAYAYNTRERANFGGLSFGKSDAVVVSCGHAATHVLPIVGGSFEPCAVRRINVGGAHMTNHLISRLSFDNHDLSPSLTTSRVESLKHELCTVSSDFDNEITSIWKDTAVYNQALRIVKVPHMTPTDKPLPSEEEQERARQARIENGRRLSEMMKEKRRSKAAAASADGTETETKAEPVRYTEEEVAPLHKLLLERYELQRISQMQSIDEEDFYMALVLAGFNSLEEFARNLDQFEEKLHGIRDSIGQAKSDLAEEIWWKRKFEDELMSIPDQELTTAKLKQKRHTKALRGAAESRRRVKLEKEAKRAEELAKQEALRKRKEEDPEGFLRELVAERQKLAEKIKRRKASRKTGSDRRSLANRNRMRLIAEHAGRKGDDEETQNNSRSARSRKGKGRGVSGVGSRSGVGKKSRGKSSKSRKDVDEDDDFGMRDSDWDVYRDMAVRKDGAESDTNSAADDERLTELRNTITEMAPDLEDTTIEKREGSALLYEPHPFPDEIPIVVDRFRVPEILFQPTLIGVEQCGLIEAITSSVRCFPENDRRNIVKEVFIAGGVSAMSGLDVRVKQDLRSVFPVEWSKSIEEGVWKAEDPSLDAWRGAALFAEKGGELFDKACISKADYQEKGADYLRESMFSNWFVERPEVDITEKKRRR